jgi:hypothetical protein
VNGSNRHNTIDRSNDLWDRIRSDRLDTDRHNLKK